MSNLHQQLKEALLEHRQLEKVSEHLADLNDRLIQETRQLRSLEKKLKKEERDVARLEKGGLGTMFKSILGDKEKQLEEERQKYLQTALKFNELGKSIELMEFEIDVLVKKLKNKDEIRKRLAGLMKLREKELMHSDPVVGRRLVEISQRVDHAHVLLKDIEEATSAGREALAILRAMEKALHSARGWGQWDMHGGGSYMKHRAIDRARDLSYRAKQALLKFKTELKDVYEDVRMDFDIQLDTFDRFTDIFFDNLISDWVVQQKIKKAFDNVRSVRRQVEAALAQMKREAPEIKAEMVVLEKEREQAILDAHD